MKPTPAQDHAEFMRRMYAADCEHQAKMCRISRFIAAYVAAGIVASIIGAMMI